MHQVKVHSHTFLYLCITLIENILDAEDSGLSAWVIAAITVIAVLAISLIIIIPILLYSRYIKESR